MVLAMKLRPVYLCVLLMSLFVSALTQSSHLQAHSHFVDAASDAEVAAFFGDDENKGKEKKPTSLSFVKKDKPIDKPKTAAPKQI